jgi:predicted pyridoxine 5'-phosphate oxidase superfamily flavin-nucleotide-binding protein
VPDARNLAFAGYTGNRQYITTGNLSENDRACLFLMDYANQRRIKVWARASVIDNDRALLSRPAEPDDERILEQAIVLEITAWDVNCPQHITRRYTEAEVEEITAPLMPPILQLEAAIASRADSGHASDRDT